MIRRKTAQAPLCLGLDSVTRLLINLLKILKLLVRLQIQQVIYLDDLFIIGKTGDVLLGRATIIFILQNAVYHLQGQVLHGTQTSDRIPGFHINLKNHDDKNHDDIPTRAEMTEDYV